MASKTLVPLLFWWLEHPGSFVPEQSGCLKWTERYGRLMGVPVRATEDCDQTAQETLLSARPPSMQVLYALDGRLVNGVHPIDYIISPDS